MPYVLPAPPPTGTVTDSGGLQWRRNPSDQSYWDPERCTRCGSNQGSLRWPDLLELRGPLTDPLTGAIAEGAAT